MFFFFQAEDGIRDGHVTGVQTCALPILLRYRVPLGNPADSDVRLATEQVLLERDGVTSSGKLSLELSSGVFEVHEASFNGAGDRKSVVEGKRVGRGRGRESEGKTEGGEQ